MELVQFFKPNNEIENQDYLISQSILDFMNENVNSDAIDESSIDPYKEIHKSFKNKSLWKPNPPNKTLYTFKRAFKMNLFVSEIKVNFKNKITKEEWKGIKELKDNPEIVIKKADKSLAVLVMNTTGYLKEGYRHLSDSNFYTNSHKILLKTYLTRYAKFLLK